VSARIAATDARGDRRDRDRGWREGGWCAGIAIRWQRCGIVAVRNTVPVGIDVTIRHETNIETVRRTVRVDHVGRRIRSAVVTAYPTKAAAVGPIQLIRNVLAGLNDGIGEVDMHPGHDPEASEHIVEVVRGEISQLDRVDI